MTNSSSKDRPLVTFALFAYNQEQFIREAVEGAFSQTYEPLEIILSDDCSSDRTYEIMQEMVEAYVGPHKVVVTQSEHNRGLAAHINRVIKIISGDVVVVAAGDDISKPERTAVIAEIFRKDQSTMAVLSNYSTLPPIENSKKWGIDHEEIPTIELIMNGGGVQIGATYAYRKKCFIWPNELPDWIQSEDRLLPFRAALLGTVRYYSYDLVVYRLPIVQSSIDQKKSRSLGYNHELHLPLLHDHIDKAKAQAEISSIQAFVYQLIIKTKVRHIKLSAKNAKFSAYFLMTPLRVIRKISVWYTNLKIF